MFFFFCTGKNQRISASFIYIPKSGYLRIFRNIGFIKTQNDRDLPALHHDQETVQQIQVRFWLRHSKHDKRLIDIGDCRTDQLVSARKDPHDVSFHIFIIQDFYFNFVSHQRFYTVFTKYSFCFTLINTGFYYVNVVESGNSFYNFTIHS